MLLVAGSATLAPSKTHLSGWSHQLHPPTTTLCFVSYVCLFSCHHPDQLNSNISISTCDFLTHHSLRGVKWQLIIWPTDKHFKKQKKNKTRQTKPSPKQAGGSSAWKVRTWLAKPKWVGATASTTLLTMCSFATKQKAAMTDYVQGCIAKMICTLDRDAVSPRFNAGL